MYVSVRDHVVVCLLKINNRINRNKLIMFSLVASLVTEPHEFSNVLRVSIVASSP